MPARKRSRRRRIAFTPPRHVTLSDGQGRPLRSTGQDGGGTRDLHRPEGERLQKVLARAGFGSRRACEALISSGRVLVDGQVVGEQGLRIDPAGQVVHVDGRRLQLDQATLTVALNKPRKVVSAMKHPEGRRYLREFAERFSQRLYHAGRPDYETEGPLLLTNHGELPRRRTHP